MGVCPHRVKNSSQQVLVRHTLQHDLDITLQETRFCEVLALLGIWLSHLLSRLVCLEHGALKKAHTQITKMLVQQC